MAEQIGQLAVVLTALDRSAAGFGSYRRNLDGGVQATGRLTTAMDQLTRGRTALERALAGPGLDRLHRSAVAARAEIGSLARTMASAAMPLAGLGVVGGAAAAATSFMNTAAQLRRGARELRMTGSDLHAFQLGAQQIAGIRPEEATEALQSLDNAVFDALGGRNPAMIEWANRRGIALTDALTGQQRNIREVAKDFAESYRILNHSPQAQRLLRQELRLAESAHGVFRQGRDGLHEMERVGQRMRPFTDHQIEAAHRLQREWGRITHTGQHFALTLGAGIVPSMERLASRADAFVQSWGPDLIQGGRAFGEGLEEAFNHFDGLVQRVQRWADSPLGRWWFDRDPETGRGGIGTHPSQFGLQGQADFARMALDAAHDILEVEKAITAEQRRRRFGQRGRLSNFPDTASSEQASNWSALGLSVTSAVTSLDRAMEAQRLGQERLLRMGLWSGTITRPEPRTGFAPGHTRRRNQDYVPPGPPPRDLLGLIGRAEGTDRGRGYNETLGYGAFTGGERNLTGMTLDEIDRMQSDMLRHPGNTSNSSAAGRYQIVQRTLRNLRRDLGLSGAERFDEAMQDRLATALAEGRGLRAYQAGRMSRDQFQNNLAQEWASIPRADTGLGHYPGQRRPGVDQGTLNSVLEGVRGTGTTPQLAPPLRLPTQSGIGPQSMSSGATLRIIVEEGRVRDVRVSSSTNLNVEPPRVERAMAHIG